MYAALPFVTGTVTTTGTGTSRTATASAGTPFATTEIVASATNTLASYLQTPQGLYQITARTSDTVVTISTLTTYVNEAAVAGTVWKLLFAGGQSANLTTAILQYNITVVAPSFTISLLTKLGAITFATSTAVRTVTTTYNGTLRNTHIASPLAVLHNQLGGLQGGAADEQYHLTAAEYTGTGTGIYVRQSTPTLITPVLGVATATSVTVSGVVGTSATDALVLPSGTTGQRGASTAGKIRYNSTTSSFEGYGTAWGSIGGGATGGGGDQVFQENSLIVTTSYTLSTGKSAMSKGPITINAGATVQIPSGYSWLIL
jgi:hypothetical protein